MTVTLKRNPDRDNPKEQDTLNAAVGVLSPGETLNITPGTWPGNVSFPANANAVGSGKDNTILPGELKFPNGGSIKDLQLPPSALLVYEDGTGDFRNLIMDCNAEFNGGTLTGDNVSSRAGTGSVTVKVGRGVSLRLTKSSLGPVSLGGSSFLLNSKVFTLGQGDGLSVITDVIVDTTVYVAGGKMTMTNVNVGKSMTILSSGAVIVEKNVKIR